MRLGGRLQAASEVLNDILERRTPAAMALRDWGKAHRFAGSKDRNAIGNIVHDALRSKGSIEFRMDSETPRALVLGAAVFGGLVSVDSLAEQAKDDQYFEALTKDEIAKLNGSISLKDAPDWVQADVPEWIWPAFENNFTDEAITEGQALSQRPPLDMRVNSIKAARDDIAKAMGFAPTELSPVGMRVPAYTGDGRHPNVQSEPQFMQGQLEIQDEGSQLVSLLVAAQPGDKVLDYCAGGGGKSLAIAADMNGQGEVHAFDIDKRRLAPTYERAMRADAKNITVHQPPNDTLKPLIGKMDRVLVDAPCTGVGTWRRKPDAKWRLTEDAMLRRMKEQTKVLDEASIYVRSGGLMFYVTCSMLAEENEQQVYSFIERNDAFTLLSAGEVWEDRFGDDGPKPWSEDGLTVTLTPASTNTDGFFFAVMEKK